MLGIGVVGLGGIAKSHLTALQIAEDEGFARCVAAADLVEELRESHRKEWEIPAVYPNHHKLLEDPNVDAVAIILGHHLHADLTIDALNAGRHVLVEKPMANTLEECDRMIEAEQASGKILQIGLTGRFHPATRKAREILDSNELGPVVTALSRFNKNWGYGGRRYQYRTRWMGGGMWMGNGVHAVDWLTHCIGAKAVAVKAKQSTSMHYQGADDVTTAFVQYANGIPGLLVVVGSAHGCAVDGIEAHCALGEDPVLHSRLGARRPEQRVARRGTRRQARLLRAVPALRGLDRHGDASADQQPLRPPHHRDPAGRRNFQHYRPGGAPDRLPPHALVGVRASPGPEGITR